MDIMIVDDELVSLAVLKQLVEKLPDCDPRGFTDASAALMFCEKNDPDLIIVDYMMPGLNGIEFTRRLRVLPGKKDTPVLMVTASGDSEVRDSALQSGINDFLSKPFDFVELQARATNMLALRTTQKKLADRNLIDAAPAQRKTADPALSNVDRVLDVNVTRARLAADEALLSEIARIFVRTVPQLLASIGKSLSGNDVKRAFGDAHSLKGAVAAFEAPEVFNSIAQLEEHAKNQDVEAARAAFTMAEALVERLVRELAPIVQRNGSTDPTS
jgi:CheY-like chemotaxis protein/HPt (histidine-containing phosphotransfer) domain-containing protein